MAKVAVIMGSNSDYPGLKDGIDLLKRFGVEVEARVMSAHRTPLLSAEFAAQAEQNGFDVIIAAAGLAAHLPGVIAAHTTLPVIGVPISCGPLKGTDALYSIVQMPTGIPVATVAIDGGYNAALLAVQILAVGNIELRKQLNEHKGEIAQACMEKDAKLQEMLKTLRS